MTRFMKLLRRFTLHREGNVLMLTGLTILILFAAAGAGIDFGRQQLIRIKLQQAADAAALAAASLPVSATDQERRDIALRYYYLNYPVDFLAATRPEPVITLGSNITVQADKTISTNFITNVNIENLDARGRSVVQRAQADVTNYDVFMVVDNSTSMKAQDVGASNYTQPVNMAQTKTSALNACAIVNQNYANGLCPTFTYPMQGYYQNLNQCLAEYPAYTCNLYLTQSPPAGDPNFYALEGPTRLNALRYVALSAVDTLLDNSDAANRVAMVAWSSALFESLPLTNNKADVRAAIGRLFAFGDTNSTLGLEEAEKGIDQAIATDTENNRIRAIVLLSDGVNSVTGLIDYTQTPYVDANGCSGGNNVCTRANDLSLAACTRLKNKNVQIYTVAFGADASTATPQGQAAQTLLKNCASPDTATSQHFFPAGTAAQLNEVFATILTQIKSLKITE